MHEEIATLVEELFRPIAPEMMVRIRHHNETYPRSDAQNSYFIQLSLDSKEDESFEDCSCSYFDMWYNVDDKRFESGHIVLQENLRGQGNGRKLVEAREELAKRLGCSEIKITLNTNTGFWRHMGYVSIDGYMTKKLNL